jgi:hypothetical protein
MVNVTSTINNDAEVRDDNDNGLFSIIYQISYIYYSMLGTLLTVFFGLIISHLSERETIQKITIDTLHEKIPGAHQHFSVGSFLSLQAKHRVSSFIRSVSQTTLRVEHKFKEVISHSNLHHLHHGDEERISILNETDDQSEEGCSHASDTGRRKMFFIGGEHEE